MDIMLRGWIRLGMLALAGTLLVGWSQGAFAQGIFGDEGETIYGGDPISRTGIKLGSWGNGLCEESSANTYAGARSLKVTPGDLYSGGRIDFPNPVDLTSAFSDPDAYLQFVIRFWGVQTGYDPWMVGLAAPGTAGMYGDQTATGRLVKRVHMMLSLEGGQKLECQADLSAYKLGSDGWMNVSFPFAVLKGKLGLPAYKLTRLVITGDGTEPFHIGQIRVVRDRTPLQADAGDEKEVARNYTIVFQGFSESGASAVKYSWDFDKPDGIQEEAVGDLIYYTFYKSGDFVVTLTVSDVFNLKKPATDTINVKVND